MSLSDIIGRLSLSTFPRVALVIFALAFVAIVLNALTRRREEIAHCSRIPLDDDGTTEHQENAS